MLKFLIVSEQAVSPDFDTQADARAWLVAQPGLTGLWALMGYETDAGPDTRTRCVAYALTALADYAAAGQAPPSAPARDAADPAWDGGWPYRTEATPVWN
jgi:hypothetical protein